MPQTFHIDADLDVCMGFAMCVLNCPEVFAIDELKTVIVLRKFDEEEFDAVQTAVESCPTGALTIDRV